MSAGSRAGLHRSAPGVATLSTELANNMTDPRRVESDIGQEFPKNSAVGCYRAAFGFDHV